MPDPFSALSRPLEPVAPDAGFAERLRARLERALTYPKGVTVSDTALDLDARAGEQRLIAYLVVADGRAALDFYAEAFGARPVGEPIVQPDGALGHAELELAGARLFLAEGSAEHHVEPPAPGAKATVSFVLDLGDVDRAVARAVAAGAGLQRPAADTPHGRIAVVVDPFGHRWMLSGTGQTVRQGDVVYVSLFAHDRERAERFYEAVLGWRYGPAAPAGHARQVEGLAFGHGIIDGQDRFGLQVCFAVDDLDEALGRVVAAGGTVEGVDDEPFGRLATVRDDEGEALWLWQGHDGDVTARTPENGAVAGDISYLTLGVRDSARARAFYAAVLGLSFSPGTIDDGWGADGTSPMLGLHGGDAEASAVAMYRVDDIHAAVERVRRAGGEAPEPELRPYGWSARCRDDQGFEFYLGQH